jgi:hypothetical protein
MGRKHRLRIVKVPVLDTGIRPVARLPRRLIGTSSKRERQSAPRSDEMLRLRSSSEAPQGDEDFRIEHRFLFGDSADHEDSAILINRRATTRHQTKQRQRTSHQRRNIDGARLARPRPRIPQRPLHRATHRLIQLKRPRMPHRTIAHRVKQQAARPRMLRNRHRHDLHAGSLKRRTQRASRTAHIGANHSARMLLK